MHLSGFLILLAGFRVFSNFHLDSRVSQNYGPDLRVLVSLKAPHYLDDEVLEKNEKVRG